MEQVVSYEWAGDHGLLPEIIGDVKFLSLTEKQYVAPVRPPVVPPQVLDQSATDKEAKIFMAENDQMKMNYAITEGFRQGFSHNFRNAFDKKYYEQLHQEVFKFKMITPRQFIEHLEKKWVKMDVFVIKRLRAQYLRGWEEEEHIMSFRVRLLREQKSYLDYATPIIITDEELGQHYLEEVLKRTDIFGEKCITEWNEKTADEKLWPHPHVFFEKRVKQLEDYQAIGGEGNSFATANSASEIQEGIAAAMEAALTKANAEHALALHDVKNGMNAQIDKLTEAMALMVKATVENKENRTPNKRRRRRNRRQVEESSDDEDSSEEEETPPRIRKKKKKKVARQQPAWQPAGQPNKNKSFAIGKDYKPSMIWDHQWDRATQDAWNEAKQRFYATGTKEAIKDKVEGLRAALKRAKATKNTEKTEVFKTALAKWEKTLRHVG